MLQSEFLFIFNVYTFVKCTTFDYNSTFDYLININASTAVK